MENQKPSVNSNLKVDQCNHFIFMPIYSFLFECLNQNKKKIIIKRKPPQIFPQKEE